MIKDSTKIAVLALLAGTALGAEAAVVSPADAKLIATDFITSAKALSPTQSIPLKLVATGGTSTKPTFYVFNATDGKAFVIVSAEDCTSPIVGYSLTAAYPVSSTPVAMKWVLSGLEKEIKEAPKHQKSISLSARRAMALKPANATNPRVLDTPKWSQESPFNNNIPGRPLVGCVGTAMAEIMRYHKYPASGTGALGGVDFADGTYDWDNMRMDNYRSGYTADQAAAVAKIMWHAAKSVATEFGMSGSSAYEVRVPAALASHFGYDAGATYKKRSDVASQDEWDAIVINEINAGRPVLYCGQDVSAGHAFVCDGYDAQGLLHFNWGWGGSADGYFKSTMLNPTVSRTHYYNNLQTIVYNIKPNADAIKVWSPVHITGDDTQVGIGTDLTDLASGQKFTVRAGQIKNLGFDSFSGRIAVALYGADGAFKAILSNEAGINLASTATLSDRFLQFTGCQAPAGVSVADNDVVRLATKADGADKWLPVAADMGITGSVPAKREAPDYFAINFPSAVTGATVTRDVEQVIKGWDYSFKVVADNASRDVVIVKANGNVLSGDNSGNFRIGNVTSDQNVQIFVKDRNDLTTKRSIWVNEPGTLANLISDTDAGTVKELTLFGNIDSRDLQFLAKKMRLRMLDMTSVYIAPYGDSPSNTIPYNTFADCSWLQYVYLPNSLRTLGNGAFRYCTGLRTIVIPGNVNKYEYNVFLANYSLRDIYVGRETAEFVNWCVFSGTNRGAMTLHTTSARAVNNYRNKAEWNQIANIIVDPYQAAGGCNFTVMTNDEVKFECEQPEGAIAPGTAVRFKATHIADNDNRMDVYANKTPLTADAQGFYNVTVNENTIIHFELTKPVAVRPGVESFWKLTNYGLVSDVVNVLPGAEFEVSINGLNVSSEASSLFYAMVLTDKDNNIKEFISPVTLWTGGACSNLKANVKCRVANATVRPGNKVRLVTTFNRNNPDRWEVVNGTSDDVRASLDAINNQSPVYNITLEEKPVYNAAGHLVPTQGARLTGLYKGSNSMVRGRDITLTIVPNSAAERLNFYVNGTQVTAAAPLVNYNFSATEDLAIAYEVIPYGIVDEMVINLNEPYKQGEGAQPLFWDVYHQTVKNAGLSLTECRQRNEARAAQMKHAKVTIIGKLDYTDFNMFRDPAFVNSVKKVVRFLDLSQASIVADRSAATSYKANVFPANAFYNVSTASTETALEDIKMPGGITEIMGNAFKDCKRLKEFTMPSTITNKNTASSSGGLYPDIFSGCTSLQTIYMPCAPVYGYVNHIRYATVSSVNNLGISDPSKVTVIVNKDHLSSYMRNYEETTTIMGNQVLKCRNGWTKNGFNIVHEYPVYGVNYDPKKVFVADPNLDITRVVSFLGENCSKENERFYGLYISALSDRTEGRPNGTDAYNAARPTNKVKVYDNGYIINNGYKGNISINFTNPKFDMYECGNHDIKVIYLNDVKFSLSSDMFKVQLADAVENNTADLGGYIGGEATKFEVWNTLNALQPVLSDVEDGKTVRFRIESSANHDGTIEARVKANGELLSADDEGYYSVTINDADINVEVFAVPVNGASLSPEEFASIDPQEAYDITSIALEGSVTPEMIATIKESFASLSTLDLSNMTSELPISAFSGMETVTNLVLPANTTFIPASCFQGCTNLTSVTVPETVETVAAGAFDGCSSLSTLTLTGVNEIGAGAFNGCTNLTSINLNAVSPDAAAAAPRRARRAANHHAQAFAGLNPNCLVVLDEGVEVPAASANYIATATEGTGNDQKRVYTAASDINLKAGSPLAVANEFTVPATASISLTATARQANGDGVWSNMLVPFDGTNAVTTLGADGSKLEYSLTAETDTESGYVTVAQYNAETDKFNRRRGYAANTPQLVRIADPEQDITVTATNVTVPATPASVSLTTATGIDMVGSYQATEVAAATTVHRLNESGTAFVATAQNNDAPAQIAPFEVYATAPMNIDVASDDVTSGIADAATSKTLRVVVEGSDLVVYATSALQSAVYRVDGLCMGTLRLAPGRNVIENLAPGIYIIEGIKAVVK